MCMTKLHSSQAGKLPDRDDGSAPHVATALMRTFGVGELDEASSGTRSGPSLAARPLLPGFLLPRNDETASRNPAPLPFPPPTQACGDRRRESVFSTVVTAPPLRYPGEARFLFARYHWSRRCLVVHIQVCAGSQRDDTVYTAGNVSAGGDWRPPRRFPSTPAY